MGESQTRKAEVPKRKLWPTVFVCGQSRDYYHGDPPPPKERGYFDFIEWQDAQLRRRRRPRSAP